MKPRTSDSIPAAKIARLVAHLQTEEATLHQVGEVFRKLAKTSWTSKSAGRLHETLAGLESLALDVAESRRALQMEFADALGCSESDVTLTRLEACCPDRQRPLLHQAIERVRIAARQTREIVRRIGYMVGEWEHLYESMLHVLCGSSTTDRYGATGRRCLPSPVAIEDVKG